MDFSDLQKTCNMTVIQCRVNLETSLRIYQDHMGKESNSRILGEAKCAFSHLHFKMGEWSKGKEYLIEAEGLFDEKGDKIVSLVCI